MRLGKFGNMFSLSVWMYILNDVDFVLKSTQAVSFETWYGWNARRFLSAFLSVFLSLLVKTNFSRSYYSWFFLLAVVARKAIVCQVVLLQFSN